MALITAVMPTTESRRSFWPGAVRCFLNQTFADCELLALVETDDKRPFAQVPGDRTRFVHMPFQGLTTGQKRNLINSMVETELIVHWDDDDWSGPTRIAEQVDFLRVSGKPVVGLHDLLYYRDDRTFWQYRFQGNPPYATGTSMCYRRDWWESHRFIERSIGEDSMFSLTASSQAALASRGMSQLMVARCHAGNTFKISWGRLPFIAASADMFPEEFLREAGS